MKKITKAFLLIAALCTFNLSMVQAQQLPGDVESIFEQMEEMLREFGQGNMLFMDTLMLPEFEMEWTPGMDSLGFGFDPDRQFPGFFFSDTLILDGHSMPGMGMDLQDLMEELSRSMESLDPSYFQEMEELLRQFRENGIRPDEEFIPEPGKPKKKKRVYKI